MGYAPVFCAAAGCVAETVAKDRAAVMSALDKGEVLSTLALLGQLGLLMVACVLAGFLGGLYLDNVLGTGPVLTVVLLLAGIGAGVVVSYRMIIRLVLERKPHGPANGDE